MLPRPSRRIQWHKAPGGGNVMAKTKLGQWWEDLLYRLAVWPDKPKE